MKYATRLKSIMKRLPKKELPSPPVGIFEAGPDLDERVAAWRAELEAAGFDMAGELVLVLEGPPETHGRGEGGPCPEKSCEETAGELRKENEK